MTGFLLLFLALFALDADEGAEKDCRAKSSATVSSSR
jgi:hypothetical protein